MTISTNWTWEELGFSNRVLAGLVIGNHDFDAQLLAIKSLVTRNRQADAALAQAIVALNEESLGAFEEDAQHLADVYVDHCQESIFQHAAHSMSAVGMIAPFLESLFVVIFRGLRERVPLGTATGCNSVRSKAADENFWNPHLVFGDGKSRTDIVAGIDQLSDSIGLTANLPAGYLKTLRALFAYRNKMFHNGFEWPVGERRAFEKLMIDEKWPGGWFAKSEHGSDPWIFYMSDDFVDCCLKLIDEMLEGVGAFFRAQMASKDVA